MLDKMVKKESHSSLENSLEVSGYMEAGAQILLPGTRLRGGGVAGTPAGAGCLVQEPREGRSVLTEVSWAQRCL